jgi:type I restriction enzyme M protein
VSRVFENRMFGFLKVTVERPLRLNFEASPGRITKLDEQNAFAALAASKKRKDAIAAKAEEAAGRNEQEAVRTMLATLASKGRYLDRSHFEADLEAAANLAKLKLPAPIKKAIFAALGERDPKAEICRDSKGEPEPDSELRDTENVPLPAKFQMPVSFLEKIRRSENAAHAGAKLPLFFGPEMPNDELVEAMKPAIDAYVAAEVLPHMPDAWVDFSKTKVGYEIPINRHFYVYKPPRPLAEIEADIAILEGEIEGLLEGLRG